MDRRQTLGISLQDGGIAALVLETAGKGLAVAATATLPCRPGAETLAAMARLASELRWQGRGAALGLPLSRLQPHVLRLPFQDANRLALAFPAALEENSLVPAERQCGVFRVLRTDDRGAKLLAFVVDRDFLAGLVPQRPAAFDPDGIYPALSALAHFMEQDTASGVTLLAHVDAQGADLALIRAGEMVAARFLPCMFPDAPDAPTETPAPLSAFSAGIRRTLAFFAQQGAREMPGQLVLCGPLATNERLAQGLQQDLGLPVKRWRPDKALGLELSKAQPLEPGFDAALACALAAWLPNDAGLNLRTGAFAKKSGLSRLLPRHFAGKTGRLAAVLAIALAALLTLALGLRVAGLKRESAQLRDTMVQVYETSFPGSRVVHDPYMEMRAAMEHGGAGAGAESPFFAENRATVLTLLAELSTRLPKEPPLVLRRFAVEGDTVLLRGQAASFKEVERVRNVLAASRLFTDARILSSTVEKSGGEDQVRFELSLKRAGGGQ